MQADATLNAIGLQCPLPVLKTRKRLSQLQKGQILSVLCDDPAAIIDIPHFCQEAGHCLISQAPTEEGYVFVIRKTA